MEMEMTKIGTEPVITELIPGLPEEIAVECLARLHYSAHGVAAFACRRWRDLIMSREMFDYRKRIGETRVLACLVQSLARPGLKPAGPAARGVTIYDPVSGRWDRLEPVPEYPNGLPLFCQLASSEGRLVVMGGWDPESYAPVRGVFVYEFTTRRWRRGEDMPGDRSFFTAGVVEGRVIVAGGHDRDKNGLDSAWAYDMAGDEWTELENMSQERDECEGVVIGSEFWVVSGYTTERQGKFEASADVLDTITRRWRRVENAWREGECPRSSVRAGSDGKLESWVECDEAVRVGACGVRLGERALVTGSSYQGGAVGFVVVEGQNGNKRRINVEEGFTGYVQSGCCVEV